MRNFNEIGLPAPNQYDDWRSWASALMVALDGMSGEETINFPLYVRDSSKVREGLPVGAEGDLIRVRDEDGESRLYVYEKEGGWKSTQKTIEVDLSGKADVDLENIPQQGINKILNLLAWDYSRLQTIPTTFTAPTWGWICWNNIGNGTPTVNGIPVPLGGNDSYNEGPAVLFVSPGDKVIITIDANPPLFVPCKGAVL